MFNGLNIKNLAEKNKLMMKDVYINAGINQGTFFQIISDKGNPSADKLEAIADVLNCSIDDFFDRNNRNDKGNSVVQNGGSGNAASIYGNISPSNWQKENEYLRALLEEKERLIQVLMNK
jgi:transcriptional regulator with XRE-family HTH domain